MKARLETRSTATARDAGAALSFASSRSLRARITRGAPSQTVSDIPGRYRLPWVAARRRRYHIRKTPKAPRSMGALRAAEMASASTVRVWGGSITPSSQSRAEP